MEKILKEASVTPKVTLTQDEYNRLVSLARAKAKQIEERAVEYYKKNGVCNIHIDAYVRQQNIGCDEIADTFRFDCQPQYGYVTPSDEFEANPFAIDRETRQRIMQFASRYITSSFRSTFGQHLLHINNAMRYEQRAQREWLLARGITLTGWLIAIVMCIVAICK